MGQVKNTAGAGMSSGVSVSMGAHTHEGVTVRHEYQVECVRFYHADDHTQCFHPMRGIEPPAPGAFERRFSALYKLWSNMLALAGQPRVDYCRRTHYTRRLWSESFPNLVVTAGLNKYLDATLKTGLTTPLWYVGLKDTGTPVAGDTMASHASWATLTVYSNATDPAFTPGAISAGSVDNSAAKAVFNINATDDVYGAFLKDDNTKGGATGTLLGVGDFSGGARSVQSGDTLNVQITCTLTAS